MLPVDLQRDAEPRRGGPRAALLLGLGHVRALIPRGAGEEDGFRLSVAFLSDGESDRGGAAAVRDALALDGVVELGHVLDGCLHALALVHGEARGFVGFLFQRDEAFGRGDAGEPERGARGHLLA